MLTPHTEIEQNWPRVKDPHALVEHCQLMTWLPYLTNLVEGLICVLVRMLLKCSYFLIRPGFTYKTGIICETAAS